MKGFVDKINTKSGEVKSGKNKGKMWHLYSLQMNGQWFSAGFKKPDCEEKDYVQFSYDVEEYNGKDQNVIDMDSFEQCDPPAIPSASGGGAVEAGSKDEYWAKKDMQARMGYARAAAIDVVDIALKNEVLPWAKNAKADTKMDLLLAMIDKVTDHFYNGTDKKVDAIISGEDTVDDDSDDEDISMDDIDTGDFDE